MGLSSRWCLQPGSAKTVSITRFQNRIWKQNISSGSLKLAADFAFQKLAVIFSTAYRSLFFTK